MLSDQLPSRPLVRDHHAPAAPAYRLDGTTAADWQYIFVMRSGALERHITACGQCREADAANQDSEFCGTGHQAVRRLLAADVHVQNRLHAVSDPATPAGSLF